MTQQEVVQHLSKELKHYLLDEGISVNDFAKAQGKTRQTISLYLNAKVSADSLIQMLSDLGCEVTVMVRR